MRVLRLNLAKFQNLRFKSSTNNLRDYDALVLGDEQLLTTIFKSVDGRFAIARWVYGEDEKLINNYLKTINLNTIDNWELALTLKFSGNKQYLFDSACSTGMLNEENTNSLSVNIKQGNYKIWTSFYEPDNKTKLIIHKFDPTN